MSSAAVVNGTLKLNCFLNFRYMGVNCHIDIDDCAKQPCANGGTCIDLVGKFVCSCPPGTSGYLCDINHNDCFEGACHNGGTCTDRVNGYHCMCPPGYVGPRCEGDVNECLSNPCNPVGSISCEQLINDYKCHCLPAWTGEHNLLIYRFYPIYWDTLTPYHTGHKI